MLVFLWFYRELCLKLGVESRIENEEWARNQLREEAGPLFELYRETETERELADVLSQHGELISRISPRNAAFYVAMGVMLAETRAMSDETFQRIPPEVREEIREAVETLTEKRATAWPKISLN